MTPDRAELAWAMESKYGNSMQDIQIKLDQTISDLKHLFKSQFPIFPPGVPLYLMEKCRDNGKIRIDKLHNSLYMGQTMYQPDTPEEVSFELTVWYDAPVDLIGSVLVPR